MEDFRIEYLKLPESLGAIWKVIVFFVTPAKWDTVEESCPSGALSPVGISKSPVVPFRPMLDENLVWAEASPDIQDIPARKTAASVAIFSRTGDCRCAKNVPKSFN